MAPRSVECQAQAMRPRTGISEAESLQLTRNLLRIAMFNISYIRGLFHENYYQDKFVPALEMKVKKLLPMDLESKRFIEWMEKGVFDALQKKYLRTLFLTICRGQDGPLVEEYMFSFKYAANEASEEITSMTIESSSGKAVHTNTKNQTTPQQMKQSACKMVRTLVQLMHTLDNVPNERTIIMKLHYYEDITPADYEPPFFTCSTYEDPNPWAREPLKMNVGNVDTRHYKLAIKVKSVFDPCEDENESAQQEIRSGDVMDTSDDDSSTSSEAMAGDTQLSLPPTQPNSQPSEKGIPQIDTPKQAPKLREQLEVALKETCLANKFQKMWTAAEDAHKSDTDKTEDPEFEAESLRSVRIYLQKREDTTIQMTDIMEELPEISRALMEELVERLVKEEVLIVLKKDLFHGKKIQIERVGATRSSDAKQQCGLKTKCPPTDAPTKKKSKAPRVSDELEADVQHQQLYELALLTALPREHIKPMDLQEALGDVSKGQLRKIMSQMWVDGYIAKVSKNKRIGREVFHTPEADKKLRELRALSNSKMQKDNPENRCKNMDASQPWGVLIRAHDQSKTVAESVRGRVQVLGSDLTRQDPPIQQEHSSAKNKNTKAATTFKEPPLPLKAVLERAKEPALVEQIARPNVTLSSLGAKGKRIRMPNSDSALDVNMDSQSEMVGRKWKASKVDGPIYQPPFKRVRTE